MELSTSVSHNPRPCQLAGLPQRRAGRMVCRAFGKGARSDFRLSSATQGLPEPIRTEPVQPPNATAPLAVPVPLLAAGGLGLITVCAFLIKKLRGNSSESMYGIESFSYGDQGGKKSNKDVFGNLMMKNMNTTTMPELSEDMVAAARARRQKERANHKLSLEDVELPDNHPWAVKAQVSSEEDEEVRARLRVRRRVRPAMPQEDVQEGGLSMNGRSGVRRRAPSPAEKHTQL